MPRSPCLLSSFRLGCHLLQLRHPVGVGSQASFFSLSPNAIQGLGEFVTESVDVRLAAVLPPESRAAAEQMPDTHSTW